MAYVKALREADLPMVTKNSPRTVSILGRKVGLFRAEDGTLFAMDVMCRHQNADLTAGERQGNVVICPRHAWKYDLSTGECLNEPWAALSKYETKLEDGWLKVSIGGGD